MLSIIVLLTASLGSAMAVDSPTSDKQSAPVSFADLANKLEHDGYYVRSIKRKHYGWEADVIDSKRDRLELRLGPSGNILSREYDD